MNQIALFSIGSGVFAITVYGAVMAGGLAFTRRQLAENQDLRDSIEDENHVPIIVDY